MSLEFTVDLIEQKKELHFITGVALTEISLESELTTLYQYGNSKKSKKKLADLHLTVVSIIADGEPVETITAQTNAMLAVSGDATTLYEHADSLRWRKKSGRYLRTSDTALTIATD